MKKNILLLIVVLVLLGIAVAFRTLVILSTVLLIAAALFAFIKKDEAAEARKMPWQSLVLAVLSLVIYLVNWLVLGN